MHNGIGVLELESDKPIRSKPKPSIGILLQTNTNAVFQGGIVCQADAHVDVDDVAILSGEKDPPEDVFYETVRSFTVNKISDSPMETRPVRVPRCYKIPKGAEIFASTNPIAPTKYNLSYYLKLNDGFVLQLAETLPSNVLFNDSTSIFINSKKTRGGHIAK